MNEKEIAIPEEYVVPPRCWIQIDDVPLKPRLETVWCRNGEDST